MIKHVFAQIRKFFIIGLLVFTAGYLAAQHSEQCHQQEINNRTEVQH